MVVPPIVAVIFRVLVGTVSPCTSRRFGKVLVRNDETANGEGTSKPDERPCAPGGKIVTRLDRGVQNPWCGPGLRFTGYIGPRLPTNSAYLDQSAVDIARSKVQRSVKRQLLLLESPMQTCTPSVICHNRFEWVNVLRAEQNDCT